jgi:UrcA family protein
MSSARQDAPLINEECFMNFTKTLLPIAALALSGIAAASSRDANSVTVKFGDLNLRSQAGIASLHKRIRNAAESVCAQYDTRVLGLRDGYDTCVAQAIEQGVKAVDNANLTRFHVVKGNKNLVASN